MIHTSRTVTVGKMESVINEPIMLYRGDREVEIEFNIVGSKFMFSNGGNVIKSTNATNGQLVINTPTGENMFSEVTECNDGKVVCVITKEMIDELAEVGFYSFQIRLFDESQVSRVTIPPVYQGIEIRNPIAAEDETDLVDIGLVGFSVVRRDNYENVVTFLPNGDYNKTLWEEHDVISKDRLNKVEDALYEINKGTEGLYPTFQNQYDEFSAKVNNDVKAYKEEMEDEVEQFERDMTQAFGEFKVDIEVDCNDRLETVNKALPYITHKVNIKEKMDRGLTATEAFKQAIKEAYSKSYNQTGWRSPLVIEIPSGEYIIDDTLVDSSTSVNGGRFVFKGDGYQNTKIIFNPSEEKYLFDNTGVFGFTLFEGISFQSNNMGKFMNGQGGGTGNAQGFIFEKCRFDDWLNIIYVTGLTMMSEVTFRDCRIKGGGSDSVMFHMNNPQAVNWRFIATDIESFSGTMIELLQGTTITYLQGSIIPINGTVISIPESAIPNSFGPGNNPCIQINGARFELRKKSFLVKAAKAAVNAAMVFTNCGMGGFNLTNTVEDRHYTIDVSMRGYIKFIDCHNMQNFSMRDKWSNSSSYTFPKEIIFEHTDVNIQDFLSTSTSIDVDNNYNNTLGAARIICNNHVYSILDSPMFFSDKPLITTFYKYDISNPLTFKFFDPSITTDHEIPGFTRKTIYGVSLYIYSLAVYGAFSMHVRILNKAKTVVLLEGDFIFNKSSVITSPCAPYYVKADDALIMELSANGTTSYTSVRFNGAVAIQHQ